MAWEVEYTDEFGAWWADLDGDEQESVYAAVILLETLGPDLRYPHTSRVETSRHGHMRSYGSSTAGARIASSTPSTHVASPSS